MEPAEESGGGGRRRSPLPILLSYVPVALYTRTCRVAAFRFLYSCGGIPVLYLRANCARERRRPVGCGTRCVHCERASSGLAGDALHLWERRAWRLQTTPRAQRRRSALSRPTGERSKHAPLAAVRVSSSDRRAAAGNTPPGARGPSLHIGFVLLLRAACITRKS